MKLNKILLFFISLILIIPLFNDGLINGHDTTFHLNRIVGVADAFRDGQIITKIYPNSNFGFGYIQSLVQYCDLFVYPFAILYMLGLPLVVTYKIMIIFYIVLGNIICYKVLRRISINNEFIMYCLIFYILNPYRIINIYYRGGIGDIVAYTFIPIVIYALYNLFGKNKDKSTTLGIGMSLLVLSHNQTFLMFVLLITSLFIIYFVCNIKDKQRITNIIIRVFKAGVIGFLLSFWYLVPMLEMLTSAKLVVSISDTMFDLSKNLFGLRDFFSFYIDSSRIYIPGGIERYSMGIILSLVPLLMIYKFKTKDKIIRVLFILYILLVFIVLGVIPLHKLKVLSILQFTFRWLILIIPIQCILCAYNLSKLDKKVSNIIICVFIVFSCFSLYDTTKIDKTISNYNTAYEILETNLDTSKDHNSKQISDAMFLPLSEKNDYMNDTKAIKLIDNDLLYVDHIYEYERYFSKIEFEYESVGNEMLMLPLTYYKGYKIYAYNDKDYYEIDVIDIDVYHRVTLKTLEGNYKYVVQYKGTTIQNISYIISGLTLIIIMGNMIINRRNRV